MLKAIDNLTRKNDVSHAMKQVGWCATRVTPEDWKTKREPSLFTSSFGDGYIL